MNRPLLLFFYSFCFATFIFGQHKLDSLEKQLAFVTGKDSVTILNNLGLNYAYSDLDKAKFYSELALATAQAQGYGEGEVAALINIGYSFYDREKTDSAIYFFDQAIKKGQAIADYRGVGNANNALGNLYRKMGDQVKSLTFYKEALVIQQKENHELGISAAYNNIGKTLTSLSAYDEAAKQLLKALAINEKNGWERKAALNLMGIAQLKVDQQDESMAFEYLDRIKAIEGLKDNLSIQSGLYNLYGIAYGKAGAFELAKTSFEKALKLYEDYNKTPYAPLHNYADLLNEQGKTIEAEQMALKALKLKKENNRMYSASYTLNLLTEIYLESGQLDEALAASEEALDIVVARKAKSRERKTYLDLAKIYQAKGDFETALQFQLSYQHLQDSLFNAQRAAQQQAMLVLYESEKKQQQIALQEAEIKTQNVIQKQQEARQQALVIGIGFAMVLLAIILWSYFKVKRARAHIASQNIQLSQLNQTKDKFFGIIAHDLRSPLIGLQGVGEQVDYFLKKGKTDRLEDISKSISDTTKRLNELLDNLLNWALLQNGMIPYHPRKVALRQTVDAVIELLTPLAELKNVTFKNQINEKVAVYADEKAVNTILRNLISNALKFTEDGEVSIAVQDEGQHANIIINDTGTGISAEQLPKLFELEKESKQGTMGEKGTGLGLVLCKELIELNQGTIQVASELGKGSRFIFDLPKAA